jgi:hypothetical protein
MFRVSPAALFDAVLLLVPCLEFWALPGHHGEDFDLAPAVPDLLALLSGGDAFPAGPIFLLVIAVHRCPSAHLRIVADRTAVIIGG